MSSLWYFFSGRLFYVESYVVSRQATMETNWIDCMMTRHRQNGKRQTGEKNEQNGKMVDWLVDRQVARFVFDSRQHLKQKSNLSSEYMATITPHTYIHVEPYYYFPGDPSYIHTKWDRMSRLFSLFIHNPFIYDDHHHEYSQLI